MAAQEAVHARVQEEAQEDHARVAEHHDEGHQRAPGTADLQMAEVAPVDLRLLARQRAQAQVGLGGGRGRSSAMRWRKCERSPRSRARPTMACSRAAVSVGNLASVARMKGRYGSMRLGRSGEVCTARGSGWPASTRARCRGARATAGRWCPRATSPPCAGAGSARPGQGLWSWRHPGRPGAGRGAGSPGAPSRAAACAGSAGRCQPGPAWQRWRVRQAVAAAAKWPACRRLDARCGCVHAASGAAGHPGWEPWCVTFVSHRLRRRGLTRSTALAPAPRPLRRGPCGRAGSTGSACALAPLPPRALGACTPAAVAVAAVAVAAQHDLDAATRAQEQAGGWVHAHPGTTEVLDGRVPARHTAVAPPSSARCRARYGRQASRRETAAAPTFFGMGAVVSRAPPTFSA
jgi:hypothetical protein